MSAETGVIHDIGYRRYTGRRLGRAQIIRALYWHSLRSAFGIGRGAKAKIVPVITFVVICLPAVASAVAVAQGQPRLVPYDTYVFQLRVVVMIIYIAAQAPELVSRDLRSHVLPLYFCRPLRRMDYPLAKLAAFITACLAMIEIPLLLLYVGTITQAHGGSAIWHQTKALIPGLLVGLMWAVLLASIGLVLASLSGRRAYATGAIAIFFFLTWVLAGHPDRGHPAQRPPGGGGPQGPAPRCRTPAGRSLLHDGSGADHRDPPVRAGEPVHHPRRRAAVARRHLTHLPAWRGPLRPALRGDAARPACGQRRRPVRPVPEGRCVMARCYRRRK